MSKIAISSYTGFCPYKSSERTVDIEYFEVRMSKSTKPGYKRKDILCNEKNDCPYFDHRLGCSLYREAKHV